MAHPITYVAGMSSSLDELRRCLEVLELSPGAAWADVRSRYRFLAKVYHPDRFAHHDAARIEAELRFKKINEAYHRLAANRNLLETRRPAEPRGPDRAQGPRRLPAEPDPLRWLWRLGGACLLLVGFALATSAERPPAPDFDRGSSGATTVSAETPDSASALPLTKPDLSDMSPEERLAAESACEPSRLAFGRGAYYGCLDVQVDRLAESGGAPDLSELTGKERVAAERRCAGIKQAFGPGSYYDCLRDRLRGRVQAR
jgi:curved DNA-binding protein CbpA